MNQVASLIIFKYRAITSLLVTVQNQEGRIVEARQVTLFHKAFSAPIPQSWNRRMNSLHLVE